MNENNVNFEFLGENQPCAYLDDRHEKIHYKIMHNISNKQLTNYIQHGWRRFGALIHRPICDGCNECQSIRINVNEFEFSKSVRRVINKNIDVEVFIDILRVDEERVNLYNKYHKFMEKKRGWEYKKLDQEAYHKSFLSSQVDGAYEVAYVLDNKLIGIDIIDVVEDGISSTYFVYDPELTKRALGNFSIYQNILIAKAKKLKWLYLGYYVKGCKSLEYKNKFKPYTVLQGRPDIDDGVVWDI